MSEPVETTGKKFVAFRPKQEYNGECEVWRVKSGVEVSASRIMIKIAEGDIVSSLSTLNKRW